MRRIPCVALLLLIPGLLHAEQISGKACYRYSDNEALNVARDIAFSMAKRDALEKYVVFVETTTIVENAALKNDLIASIGAGLLRNVQVTEENEDLQKREICRAITAQVEPVEVKQQIVAKINAYRRQKSDVQTGLPQSYSLKALKIRLRENISSGQCSAGSQCLEVTAQCINTFRSGGFDAPRGARITWIDQDGIPERTTTDGDDCPSVGDIRTFYLPMPPSNYTFTVDFNW